MSLAKWMLGRFNRRAAALRFKAREVIESLGVREGDTVADLGSGGGYYSLEFARRVGKSGKVYAVDTEQQNLSYVAEQAAKAGLGNVTTVLIEADEPRLPEGSVDLIFTRNAFHHLSEPAAYFRKLKPSLKPGGRIAIIDYREKRGFSFSSLFGHYTPEETILSAMDEAGYRRLRSFDFLPEQSFNLFEAES